MILQTYEKQPAEVKDYDVDYSQWLAPMNDVLVDAQTSVEDMAGGASTLVIDNTFITETMVKVWVSGGIDGHKYKITINASTEGGRTDQSELVFKLKDR